ncbi:MAG: hypothetical protein HY855_01550 [Burkholderiales bacterium]|nr:hypothetical protein [Burkholderiales bacterium]
MTLTPVAVERRQDLVLRAAFDEAYASIEPFLDPACQWGGASFTVLVQHSLREAFPQLSPQQVQILITAANRVYQARARATSVVEPAVAAHHAA